MLVEPPLCPFRVCTLSVAYALHKLALDWYACSLVSQVLRHLRKPQANADTIGNVIQAARRGNSVKCCTIIHARHSVSACAVVAIDISH